MIADGDAPHLDGAVLAEELVRRPDHPLFQRPGGEDHLEDRARLEVVGGGAIPLGGAAGYLVTVRIEAGLVSQGQDLPGRGVQHDDAARFRPGTLHGARQLALRDVLQNLVDGQVNVEDRRLRRRLVLSEDQPPQGVLLGHHELRLPPEEVVVQDLHPLEPAILQSHHPQDMRGQLLSRIEPATLGSQPDPLQVQIGDGVGLTRLELALEPDEGLVRGEARLDLFGGLTEHRGERPGRFRRILDLGRLGEDGRDAQADGQLSAGPVIDRPTAGDQR